MGDERSFLNCLAVSLLAHAALLCVIPYHLVKPEAARRVIEVAYQGVSPAAPLLTPPQDIPEPPRKPLWAKDKTIAALIKTEVLKDKSVKEFATKTPETIKKKSVNLPNIPGETFKTPEYRHYYQIIREKIRKYAYYNYKKLEEGEVFLTFSLRSDGSLEDVSLKPDRSSSSKFLRDIALKSVEEAAPYPEFPAKLKNNPRLSFNVIISFELK